MKRFVFIAWALAALMLPVGAFAQPAHIDSPTVTLTVTNTTVVGTAILQPGDYKFKCRMFDGRTFLVVTSVSTGKEIARVPCEKQTLDAPVVTSDYRTAMRADGKRTLTMVRIKGESVAHRLVD